MLTTIASLAAIGPAHAESLYNEGTYHALAADTKAYRTGDAITVLVYENSSATSSADTSTKRGNNLSAGINSTLIGKQLNGSVAVGGDFDGGGSTQRSNKLLATLTVTVREVLPDGDLRIAGTQLLTLNGEQQKVNVEGRVRPQDISTDNVVLSTRLADARIDYIGDGDLSDRQRRAWWRKVVDWLGF
ncbi:flagellar biosynthesis protein FlgH [Paraburkholderia acidicola]|uniref:Flagellar L-ring protein n=1 Tax=Paraburkholderia acidicola TaxID=1912599 RepID=A0A2A4ESA9_9BURK|nr:flagellar biosynthesis protein FlgH [Paraburkholderia acidicola]